MRLATLQFNPSPTTPRTTNIAHADALLTNHTSSLQNLDLLILPELAFTGYNHDSLKSIAPCLERSAGGPSAEWAKETARRLGCAVAVGYPEVEIKAQDGEQDGDEEERTYNSVVLVDKVGEVITNYRKRFLYYTDERWACEGDAKEFWKGEVEVKSPPQERSSNREGEHDEKKEKVKTAMGICMDINPYKFTAPWSDFEFATHVLQSQARLVLLSMAWLTTLDLEALKQKPQEPELGTLTYWVSRFEPLVDASSEHAESSFIIVFANRCGVEGDALYAGTSCVMEIAGGRVRIWDMLGKGTEGVLVVDTEEAPKYELKRK
ncbi:MAG: Carbon-nitrogen hydrolase [Cirrosporium novae-zelandiae]|nr:MAG: Carbon-nitrogen hydrolase [Cirrosporium novae-zelandiae]